MNDIDQEHARICAALDPWLPAMPEIVAEADDRQITALIGPSSGYAVAGLSVLEPDGEAALWGPVRQYTMTARLAGPDRAAVYRDLLGQWLSGLDAAPDDWDSGATVRVPSRDPVYRAPLLERGFAPALGLVARWSGTRTPPANHTVPVRPADLADLEAIAEMAVALQEFDVESGWLAHRPAARDLLFSMVERNLQAAAGWTWWSGTAARPLGFLQVHRPAQAEWTAGMSVAGARAAYLAEMYVVPDARSGGVGSTLVAAAHAALDAAGVPLTLLHHAIPNPYSTPFWARMGYRPLWTLWARRPAAGPRR